MKVLTLGSEMRRARIWRGHLAALEEVLGALEVVDFERPQPLNVFAGEVAINIGNHQFAGSKLLNAMSHELYKCTRLIAVCDDYTSPPATQVRRAVAHKDNIVITHMPTLLEKLGHLKAWSWAKQQWTVDLNSASWNMLPMLLNTPKHPGLLYYGACRPGRLDLFEEYLDTALYPVTIATSARGRKRFEDELFITRAQYITEQLDIPHSLQEYAAVVYMEEALHRDGLSQQPANRFYECLSAGVAQFFDEGSCANLRAAGFAVPAEWIVNTADDVQAKLPFVDSVRKCQRALWAKDYRGRLLEQLKGRFHREGLHRG